jgi:hypothetical protein
MTGTDASVRYRIADGKNSSVYVHWDNPWDGVNSWDQNIDQARWHPPFPLTPPGAAQARSPLAACSRAPEHLDVLWLGPDGAVGSAWWDQNIDNARWASAVSAHTIRSRGDWLFSFRRDPCERSPGLVLDRTGWDDRSHVVGRPHRQCDLASSIPAHATERRALTNPPSRSWLGSEPRP